MQRKLMTYGLLGGIFALVSLLISLALFSPAQAVGDVGLVSLDFDTTNNTATFVDTVETCVEVAPNDTAVAIDVVVENNTYVSGGTTGTINNFQVNVTYPAAAMTLTGSDLSRVAGFWLEDGTGNASNFGGGANPPVIVGGLVTPAADGTTAAEGVWARIVFDIPGGAPDGVFPVTITAPNSVTLFLGDGSFPGGNGLVQASASGFIAVAPSTCPADTDLAVTDQSLTFNSTETVSPSTFNITADVTVANNTTDSNVNATLTSVISQVGDTDCDFTPSSGEIVTAVSNLDNTAGTPTPQNFPSIQFTVECSKTSAHDFSLRSTITPDGFFSDPTPGNDSTAPADACNPATCEEDAPIDVTATSDLAATDVTFLAANYTNGTNPVLIANGSAALFTAGDVIQVTDGVNADLAVVCVSNSGPDPDELTVSITFSCGSPVGLTNSYAAATPTAVILLHSLSPLSVDIGGDIKTTVAVTLQVTNTSAASIPVNLRPVFAPPLDAGDPACLAGLGTGLTSAPANQVFGEPDFVDAGSTPDSLSVEVEVSGNPLSPGFIGDLGATVSLAGTPVPASPGQGTGSISDIQFTLGAGLTADVTERFTLVCALPVEIAAVTGTFANLVSPVDGVHVTDANPFNNLRITNVDVTSSFRTFTPAAEVFSTNVAATSGTEATANVCGKGNPCKITSFTESPSGQPASLPATVLPSSFCNPAAAFGDATPQSLCAALGIDIDGNPANGQTGFGGYFAFEGGSGGTVTLEDQVGQLKSTLRLGTLRKCNAPDVTENFFNIDFDLTISNAEISLGTPTLIPLTDPDDPFTGPNERDNNPGGFPASSGVFNESDHLTKWPTDLDIAVVALKASVTASLETNLLSAPAFAGQVVGAGSALAVAATGGGAGFGDTTITVLDGSSFTNGDVIRIVDGANSEDRTITVSGDDLSFGTELDNAHAQFTPVLQLFSGTSLRVAGVGDAPDNTDPDLMFIGTPGDASQDTIALASVTSLGGGAYDLTFANIDGGPPPPVGDNEFLAGETVLHLFDASQAATLAAPTDLYERYTAVLDTPFTIINILVFSLGEVDGNGHAAFGFNSIAILNDPDVDNDAFIGQVINTDPDTNAGTDDVMVAAAALSFVGPADGDILQIDDDLMLVDGAVTTLPNTPVAGAVSYVFDWIDVDPGDGDNAVTFGDSVVRVKNANGTLAGTYDAIDDFDTDNDGRLKFFDSDPLVQCSGPGALNQTSTTTLLGETSGAQLVRQCDDTRAVGAAIPEDFTTVFTPGDGQPTQTVAGNGNASIDLPNETGCAGDTDNDTIPDAVDQCINLPEDDDDAADGYVDGVGNGDFINDPFDQDGCPDTDAKAVTPAFGFLAGDPTATATGNVDIASQNGNYGPTTNAAGVSTRVNLDATVTFAVSPDTACDAPEPSVLAADGDTTEVIVAGNVATFSELGVEADDLSPGGPDERETTIVFSVSNCDPDVNSELTVTTCIDPKADAEFAPFTESPAEGAGDVCAPTSDSTGVGCCSRVDEEDTDSANTESKTTPLNTTDDNDNDGKADNVDECPNTDQPTPGDPTPTTPGGGLEPDFDSTTGCADNQVDIDGDDFCDNGVATQKNTTLCSGIDNCPTADNPGQQDADGDNAGNTCDDDDDDDGILDGDTPQETTDTGVCTPTSTDDALSANDLLLLQENGVNNATDGCRDINLTVVLCADDEGVINDACTDGSGPKLYGDEGLTRSNVIRVRITNPDAASLSADLNLLSDTISPGCTGRYVQENSVTFLNPGTGPGEDPSLVTGQIRIISEVDKTQGTSSPITVNAGPGTTDVDMNLIITCDFFPQSPSFSQEITLSAVVTPEQGGPAIDSFFQDNWGIGSEIIFTKTIDAQLAAPTVQGADTDMTLGASEPRAIDVDVTNSAGSSEGYVDVNIDAVAPANCTASSVTYSDNGTPDAFTGDVGADRRIHLAAAGVETVTVTGTFTIDCTDNDLASLGGKTWTYSASASVPTTQPDGPSADDPDTTTPSNGPKDVQQTVTVAAVANVSLGAASLSVLGGSVRDVPFNGTVTQSFTNSGFDKANYEATITLTPQDADCDAGAGGGVAKVLPPQTLTALDAGGETAGSADNFSITCSTLGTHNFTANINIDLAGQANITDAGVPDDTAPSGTNTLTGDEADLSIVITSAVATPDVDGGVGGVQQPTGCPTCKITVDTSVSNVGFDGAEGDVTVTVTPQDTNCSVESGTNGDPASKTHLNESISTATASTFVDEFSIECISGASEAFTVTAEVVLDQANLTDPTIPNEATTPDVLVEVFADSDGDGIATIDDNCPDTENGPAALGPGDDNQNDTDDDDLGDACDPNATHDLSIIQLAVFGPSPNSIADVDTGSFVWVTAKAKNLVTNNTDPETGQLGLSVTAAPDIFSVPSTPCSLEITDMLPGGAHNVSLANNGEQLTVWRVRINCTDAALEDTTALLTVELTLNRTTPKDPVTEGIDPSNSGVEIDDQNNIDSKDKQLFIVP